MLTAGIFKANDIRGRIGVDGAEWDLDGVRAVGAAFVVEFGLQGAEFVMGRDTRVTGAEVAKAFAEGARGQGAGIVDIGLTSTDALWFASGVLGLHGAMFTASHNPADYNGAKFCLPGAAPVSDASLISIRDLAMGEPLPEAAERGGYRELDILRPYGERVRSLVDLDGLKPLTVVVDAGNGMAGLTVPVVLGALPLEIIGLYLDLDGTFPNHMPNPLIEENLVDAQMAVRGTGADLGLVFDGDADRCFIIDEFGEVVSPSVVTALIATQELRRDAGGTIVINTITSRCVGEAVARSGGELVISKVGHTAVKAKMAAHNAIFGGEHSAHYYFRDFWGADTGILAGLHIIAMVGRTGRTVSELAAEFAGYQQSGEINSVVADIPGVLAAISAAFAGRGQIDAGDGITVSGDDWWLNVRASNTEPLLRLNVEARDRETMVTLRDEALSIIREGDFRE